MEETTDDNRISTSGIGFLRHKLDKLGQQNENNLFSNIL